MTRRSTLGSGRRVISLPCGFSAGFSSLGVWSPRIATASGICVANTWKDVFSHTGAGSLKALLFGSSNGTAKTIYLRIERDGVEIFNQAQAVANTNSYAAVGSIVFGTLSSLIDEDISYDKSLLIQYKCSISETDGANIQYRYEVRE